MSENNMGSGDAAASIKSEKSKDIRSTNIIAAKGKYIPHTFAPLNVAWPRFIALAVADVVRTSLGPRGMDKMVSPESSSVEL